MADGKQLSTLSAAGSSMGNRAGLIGGWFARFKHGDILFALGVSAILAVLLVPVPPGLLDFLLGISITVSVLILMTVLFVDKPLSLSAFPTILLITALLRLSLNIASTRLILANGDKGAGAAGEVIHAFGDFVMAGSAIIGAIIFAILTIINFVVITKGSGRIAEVAARFNLDAMPGRQMAIDADLSAGLMNEEEAKAKRKELSDENTFYGAMDGANKFVRGDAIAGLLITFINLIGGMLIGIIQKDMEFAEAVHTYTILSVGDGLVSQLPALIVSISAGLLVTKAGAAGSADKAVVGQLIAQPQALAVASGIMMGMALLPGIPFGSFGILALCLGFAAFMGFRSRATKKVEAEKVAAERQMIEGPAAKPAEEDIAETLQIDSLRLELGYGLLPLINYQKGHRLTDQIKALRKQVARDLGFVIPPVRIQDNMQLPANTYIVRVKEVEAGRGDIRPDMLLVMDPAGGRISIPGEETTEPTFGLPAMWVADAYREEALFKNFTVVDPPTVITTHLTELVKENMSDLLSYSETQKLLDDMPKDQQKLVADTIPGQITISGMQRVLQNLLQEMVSIRDMPAIVEAVAEASRITSNLTMISEHVRMRLARQISYAYTNEEGYIPIVALSGAWEQAFAESLSGGAGERTLSMAPSKVQEFINVVRKKFDQFAMQGEMPVLLTSPGVRPYVRSVIERFRPTTIVLSQNEIHAKARIKTLGQL
ncbi:MAG: flagellar biosynthesis protein FlhA [Alphaproteobacteria bacterium]|nr:flagellar biosynthesis protein FlhA [Alphaproteobacteria bacterium]